MRKLMILMTLMTMPLMAHVSRGHGDTYTVDSSGAEWDMDKDDFRKSPYDVNCLKNRMTSHEILF